MPLSWIRHRMVPEQPAEAAACSSPTINWSRGSGKDSERSAVVHADPEREHLVQELARAHERISELTRLQVDLTDTIARLNELASTDMLTGLDNRRRFDEALRANFSLAIRQGSTLSVIMLDVDRFKGYNDSYGHPAGDAVLCGVSEQLVKNCTTYDVAARIGGEEFAVLLPTADAPRHWRMPRP